MPSVRALLKSAIVRVLAGTTHRHPVLLPSDAAGDTILNTASPYRVEGESVAIQILENAKGTLAVELLTYEGHFPTRSHWIGSAWAYNGPCLLQLCLATGTLRLAGEEIGRVTLPLPTRRFCMFLRHTDRHGESRSRLTGHYLAITRDEIDEHYYTGDDYVNHEAESAGDPSMVLDLLRKYDARGPVLEIGCATGGMIQALSASGFDTYGVDISRWAIGQATRRVGSGRAWVCDIENQPLPEALREKDRFGVLLLWAVLEHFRDPFAVLSKLAPSLKSGGLLVINTTNAASLGHSLFGRDWEGYFDYSHHGVDQVSTITLADELKKIGFDCLEMPTDQLWDGCADPTHATLREWWAADSRFRRLLTERLLGDMIHCAARKA